MSMSERCCCGRRTEFISPVIVNGIKHEAYGPVGNFCGPVLEHDFRDISAELVEKNKQIKDLENRLMFWRGLRDVEDGDEV